MPHIEILSETFAYSDNGINVKHYVKGDVVEVDESTAEQFIARKEVKAVEVKAEKAKVDKTKAKVDKVVLENKIEKLDDKIVDKTEVK